MYGIFTYSSHHNPPNVGKYTSPMAAMGKETQSSSNLQRLRKKIKFIQGGSLADISGGTWGPYKWPYNWVTGVISYGAPT